MFVENVALIMSWLILVAALVFFSAMFNTKHHRLHAHVVRWWENKEWGRERERERERKKWSFLFLYWKPRLGRDRRICGFARLWSNFQLQWSCIPTADIRTLDIHTLVSSALLTLLQCWLPHIWLCTGVVRTFVFHTLVRTPVMSTLSWATVSLSPLSCFCCLRNGRGRAIFSE